MLALPDSALHNASGLPLRFVPQEALPEGRAYEEFIGATGCVPTRDNLHDFFNALVWLSFPRIKQPAQCAAGGADRAGRRRQVARAGARRRHYLRREFGAAGGARFAQGRELVDALRGHRWQEAFCQRRAAFGGDAQVWLFGHALMEKLVAPRKAITAHTRVVTAGDDYFALAPDAQRAWIDARVAGELAAEGLSTACFTPLPVLGIPGWWPQQDDDFYADTSVFRPKRAT